MSVTPAHLPSPSPHCIALVSILRFPDSLPRQLSPAPQPEDASLALASTVPIASSMGARRRRGLFARAMSCLGLAISSSDSATLSLHPHASARWEASRPASLTHQGLAWCTYSFQRAQITLHTCPAPIPFCWFPMHHLLSIRIQSRTPLAQMLVERAGI